VCGLPTLMCRRYPRIKEPHISVKEPCISAKEPYIFTKEVERERNHSWDHEWFLSVSNSREIIHLIRDNVSWSLFRALPNILQGIWSSVLSYEKATTVGPYSGESVIVFLANTASIAKICAPFTQIQKLVQLKHSSHHLCAVCTATHTATHCNTHCNTLQHTATHSRSLICICSLQ